MSQPFFPAAGFHGHVRQPEQCLRLCLSHCPEPIAWAALDQWLSDNLGLALQSSLPESSSPTEAGAAANAARLCWRIMQVAAALQRAARIPVFEPGRLLSVQADASTPGGWLAEVRVAHIDYVPQDKTRLAYDAATLLVLSLAAAPGNFATVEPLYQQLELKVLQPLRAAMPVGKSALPLLACAHERGIPWRHLGAGVFRLGWGAQSLNVQNSKVSTDSALGVAVAQNKWVAAEWMRRAGLPAPHNRLANNEQEALAAQAALGWPLVVKPADRDRGEGVVVDITDPAQLLSAFRQARALSAQVLVECQASGVCHRILVVRGEVIYVVKRLPIAVCGDGRQTVEQLIHAANSEQLALPSWERAPLYPCDELTIACLQLAGLTLQSVLDAGVWATLRPIESTSWGGLDEDCLARMHPDNAALACRAAALFGLEVAGIDLISADISQPWHSNAAIINEVNSAPVLGQSDSSRRTLPQVLTRLLPARGRIPVEACVGTEHAWVMARERQQAWLDKGIACYLTSHNLTLTPAGHVLHLAQDGLFNRCLALLADTQVEAVVLLVQTDDVLSTGLPADNLHSVIHSGEALVSPDPDEQRTKADAVLALLKRLCNG